MSGSADLLTPGTPDMVSDRLVVDEIRFDDLDRSRHADGTQCAAETCGHEGLLIGLAIPNLGHNPTLLPSDRRSG